MSETMRISVTREQPPPAVATAEGLPDTSTQQSTRHNAKLLWQAARLRAGDTATPYARNSRPGVLARINVSKLMADMWDGYMHSSPFHSPSVNARTILYRYLRDATVMVCTERRAGDASTWWIANEWQDRPAHVTGTWTERKITATQAGEDRDPASVEVRFTCRFPGCADKREFSAATFGRHLGIHSVTFRTYKQMLNGEIPWPGSKPDNTKGNTEAMSATHSGDPLAAVEALVAEVRQARALIADSDLVDENRFLRAELEETRAQNTKLRQRLEAADKVLGRR